MAHQFLSDEWIAAARAVRARHGDVEPTALPQLAVNMTITDAPFGDADIESYLDTSSGEAVLELGVLDSPDVSITTDYETARAIFTSDDAAAGMQAFFAGKIVVNGDMMKLMTMPAVLVGDERAREISEEIRAITA